MTSISFGHENYGFQVGVHNGPIHMSQEQTKPRPEPLWTVPFPRDPDFVGRHEILDQIQEKTSVAGSRVALVGLGGVGKTQLAIEYCHRVRQRSPDTWVFWVHASNSARCERSLRDLADRAKIPGRQDRNAHIFQLFGNWLQDGELGNWILVLDNVDDDELLRKSPELGTEGQMDILSLAPHQPSLRYLLSNSNGAITITSRNRGVALDVVDHKNLIEVQPMNQTEALDLIQKKLSTPTEHEKISQLSWELEFMPLAIVQAASYIVHLRCSVSQYLLKLQKSDREAVRLLSEEAGLLHRDWEAKNSVLLTWQISFDYIRRMRPSAIDLLSLMSFFDRQGITEAILKVARSSSLEKQDGSSSEQDTDDESSETDIYLEKDLLILGDFSLISVGENDRVFVMHRLVQLTVRTWLQVHGLLEQWKGQFIAILYSKVPTGEYKNWETCRSLFPHVKSALSHRPKSRESRLQWACVLYRGAWYARDCGQITESRAMASRSMEYRSKTLGEDNEETLASIAMLATIYQLGGLWEKAEKLDVQVMQTCKTKLGVDHPSTLTNMANLASTFWSQGRWEEAEKLFIQVMQTSKTKLGVDHPSTLTSMANLASTYRNQGRWEEAEKLDVQVMQTRKTKLGADHPSTLTSMANLAFTWQSSGRLSQAIQLLKECLAKQQQVLGPAHPEIQSNSVTLLRWETVDVVQ